MHSHSLLLLAGNSPSQPRTPRLKILTSISKESEIKTIRVSPRKHNRVSPHPSSSLSSIQSSPETPLILTSVSLSLHYEFQKCNRYIPLKTTLIHTPFIPQQNTLLLQSDCMNSYISHLKSNANPDTSFSILTLRIYIPQEIQDIETKHNFITLLTTLNALTNKPDNSERTQSFKIDEIDLYFFDDSESGCWRNKECSWWIVMYVLFLVLFAYFHFVAYF